VIGGVALLIPTIILYGYRFLFFRGSFAVLQIDQSSGNLSRRQKCDIGKILTWMLTVRFDG
jgi:hypothetical protein